MGLREKCNLGAVFFPRASFFSAFLRWRAHSLRAISFVVVVFRLAVLFHCPPRAGPARSGSATRPLLCCMLLCELRAAGSCASAEHGGASFSSSFSRMLVVPRANRSFQHVFGFSRRRRDNVCVCMYVDVYMCRYACMYLYVCVCICMCMYVYVYVCVYQGQQRIMIVITARFS